ncbi:hypothetical protein, partial [Bacillus licheniformis]|uniref:hypothetical protein n=1 Tax=Bacillus licheniformis TaxID=1402 RepID=UPI001C465A4E
GSCLPPAVLFFGSVVLRSYLPGFPAFQTGECAGSSYCNKKRTLVKAFFFINNGRGHLPGSFPLYGR